MTKQIKEVFKVRNAWHVIFNGAIPKKTWPTKGEAMADLVLLKAGYIKLNEVGIIQYRPQTKVITNVISNEMLLFGPMHRQRGLRK